VQAGVQFDNVDDEYTAASTTFNLDTGTISWWANHDHASSSATPLHAYFDTVTSRYTMYRSSSTANRHQFFVDGRNRDWTLVYAADVWVHMLVVYDKGSDLKDIYIDGSLATPVGGSSGTWGSNSHGTTHIAAAESGSSAFFFAGSMAEFATYDVVLTAADITALSKKASPLLVRPDNLIRYWPMYGPDRIEPKFGPAALTKVDAPTQDDHPGVFMPSTQIFRFPAAGVAGAGPLRRRR